MACFTLFYFWGRRVDFKTPDSRCKCNQTYISSWVVLLSYTHIFKAAFRVCFGLTGSECQVEVCTGDPESWLWEAWTRSWPAMAPPSPRGRGSTHIRLPTGSGAPFPWVPTAPAAPVSRCWQLVSSATAINISLPSSVFASHRQAHHPGPDTTPYSDRRTVNHVSCPPSCQDHHLVSSGRPFILTLSCLLFCPPTEPVPDLDLCRIMKFILSPETC